MEMLCTALSPDATGVPTSLLHVAGFMFSMICFVGSFCFSIYLLDSIGYLWSSAMEKIKLRPYSPSFSKLERQLQSACASEDSEIWCLRHKRLSAYEFKSLVIPLLADPKVRRWRSLHLEGNEIGFEGCDQLFMSLMGESCVCRVEFLSLKQCGVTILPQSLRMYLCQDTASVRQLDLSGNDLSDEQISSLSACLPSSQLRMLDLSRNKMTHKGMRGFGRAIAWSRVEDLRLRRNNLGNEGVMEFVSEALASNSPLKYLDLSANNIGNEGMHALADSMKTSRLQELNLMDNAHIRDVAMVALAKNLRSLRTLNVSQLVRLTDESVYSLIDAAKHSLLKRLVWYGIPISRECEAEMSRIFHLVGSRHFHYIILLCSAKDIPRIGRRSAMSTLPKDLIRTIIEALYAPRQLH